MNLCKVDFPVAAFNWPKENSVSKNKENISLDLNTNRYPYIRLLSVKNLDTIKEKHNFYEACDIFVNIVYPW